MERGAAGVAGAAGAFGAPGALAVDGGAFRALGADDAAGDGAAGGGAAGDGDAAPEGGAAGCAGADVAIVATPTMRSATPMVRYFRMSTSVARRARNGRPVTAATTRGAWRRRVPLEKRRALAPGRGSERAWGAQLTHTVSSRHHDDVCARDK